MDKLYLNGNEWKLVYVKNSVYKADGDAHGLTELVKRGYETVSAEVPGNLEIDLQRAGVIEDPFYADNHSKRDC